MSETAPSSGPGPRPFPLKTFLIPAVVVLGVLSLLPLARAVAALGFSFQLDREEGFLLNQAMRLAGGKTIYPSLDQYPYLVGNYPPVYPFVYAIFVKLFGPSLPLGRLVNLAGALGLFAVLAGSIAARTRRVVPAVLAPVLFAATWGFNQWIAYARVDIVALFFTVWGVARFVAAPERGGKRGTALLFALALFTRQTMVAGPLAALCTLAIARNWKALRSLAFRVAIYCIVAYGLLFLVTGGRAWSHLVTYNANPFHWHQVQVWARHLWWFQKFPIATAALAFICLTYLEKWEGWRRESDSALAEEESGAAESAEPASPSTPPAATSSFLSVPETLYLLFGFGAFLMVGKEGAASNYLLEFHAALALFLGIHVGRVVNLSAGGLRHHALGLLKVLMFLGISFHAAWLSYLFLGKRVIFSDPPPGAAERLAGTEVLETVERFPGPMISEYPIFAILTDREVLYQPFIMRELAIQGLWDEDPFVDDLRAGRFALLVTTQDIENEDQAFAGWTQAMREAIRSAYRLVETVDHGRGWQYWFYRPRTLPADREEAPPESVP